MPQQKVVLNPKGLFTNVNQLGAVPPGALSETMNVVISRPGVLGCRRGRDVTAFFSQLSNQSNWTAGPEPLRLFNATLRVGGEPSDNYLGNQIPGVITMMADGSMYWSIDGTNFQRVAPTYGQTSLLMGPVSDDRAFYGFEQNGALYVNTSAGVVMVARPIPNSPVTSLYVTPTPEQEADWSRSGYSPAGVPWGVNTQASLYQDPVAANNQAILGQTQVAYRFCFGYRDANNVLHLGAPSNRAVVKNDNPATEAGKRNAKVSTIIPPGINYKQHFWQLYRTLGSSGKDVDPGDDEGLIAEGAIPAPLSFVNASRTGTVATITTSAAHGLVTPVPTPKQTVTINEDIVVDTGVVAPLVSITQKNAGVREIAFNNTAPFGTFTLRDSGGGNQLLIAGNTTGKTFYVEQDSPWVYIITAGGMEYLQILDKVRPDLAVYDDATGSIHIYGRPYYSDRNTFDYSVESAVHVVISNAPGGTFYQSAYQTSPIASSASEPSLSSEVSTNWKAALLGTQDKQKSYFCILAAGRGDIPATIYCSTNNGSTWSSVLPLRSYSAAVSQFAYTYVTASKTLTNRSTGAIDTFFAVFKHESLAVGTLLRYFDTYRLYLDSLGVPTLQDGMYYWNVTTSDAPAGVQYRIYDIEVTPNGEIWMCYKFGDTVPNYYDEVSSFGNWNPANMTGNYALPQLPTSSNDTGNNRLSLGIMPNGDVLVYQVLYGAQFNLWQNLISGGVVTPTLIGLNPNSFSLANAAGMSGGARNLPTIPAGLYEVQSVPSATTFTITSVQNPQTNFVATPIVAVGYLNEITYIDTVAPTFIGPYLYTAPSAQGILQANYPPPTCNDIALFRTFAFYADTITSPVVNVTMLKLPTDATSRIYLGGNGAYITGTVAGAEDAQAKVYKIYTTLASQEENLKQTISSIARVVNLNYPTFKCLIYPIGIGIAQFSSFAVSGAGHTTVNSAVQFFSSADGISPIIGVFTPNKAYGEAKENKNYLAFSKTDQPDAVPLVNYLRIGSDSKRILRIIPSRDALFVFKEEGCFIVRGYGPPWQVDPYDLTLQLSLRDSLVQLDNAVFGAFTRGVFKISDSNVELISLPIQDRVEQYLSGDLNNVAWKETFAVGDNPDHKYLLWLPRSYYSTYPSLVYVYDTFTNEWSTWDMEARHAISFQDKHLLFSAPDECVNNVASLGIASGKYPAIWKENKTLTDKDFHDGRRFFIPDANIGNLFRVTESDDPTFTMRIGDGVNQQTVAIGANDIISQRVLLDGVDVSSPSDDADYCMPLSSVSAGQPFEVVPSQSAPYPVDTEVYIYRAIRHGWKLAQSFPGTPAATNHFSEISVNFRRAYWKALVAIFALPPEEKHLVGMIPTDVNQYVEFDGLKHFSATLRPVFENNFIRTYVPRQCQRGTMIACGIATAICGKPVESNGMTITLTQGPTSFARR